MTFTEIVWNLARIVLLACCTWCCWAYGATAFKPGHRTIWKACAVALGITTVLYGIVVVVG